MNTFESYSEQLIELIYFSIPLRSFKEIEIQKMLSQVRPKNQAMHVTGMLLYANEQFLQVLEGRRKDVNSIFQSISHDARHYDINLVSVRDIEERNFEHWDMAFSGGDDVRHLRGQQNKADFNVQMLTPDEALALLVEEYELLSKATKSFF